MILKQTKKINEPFKCLILNLVRLINVHFFSTFFSSFNSKLWYIFCYIYSHFFKHNIFKCKLFLNCVFFFIFFFLFSFSYTLICSRLSYFNISSFQLNEWCDFYIIDYGKLNSTKSFFVLFVKTLEINVFLFICSWNIKKELYYFSWWINRVLVSFSV